MKRILFFILICIISRISAACDLNHDWRSKKVESYRDVDPLVFSYLLREKFESLEGKTMVLSVKDLYSKEGVLRENSSSITDRSTSSRILLETKLMRSGIESEKLLFLNLRKEGLTEQDLYQPHVLKNLSKKYQVKRFLRVKLRKYSVLNRTFQDAYPHNKNVFQESKLHHLDLFLSEISPLGKYSDFKDLQLSFENSHIFQGKGGEKISIVRKELLDSGNVLDEIYFFGLDGVNSLGQKASEYAHF